MNNFIIKNKRGFAALCACVAIAALVGAYTYSKYVSDNEVDGTVTLEEFYAIARIYYESGGEEKEITVDTNNRKEYVTLTADEFNTARVDIEYTGRAKTYCRFRVDCSWLRDVSETYRNEDGEIVTNNYTELIPHEYPSYELDEAVYDNIEKDGWLYIKEIMETDGESKKTINAITSIKSGDNLVDRIEPEDEAEYVQILVTVDCVQYNRVSALWNMNTLPWWGS